jgi:hypothetical protein
MPKSISGAASPSARTPSRNKQNHSKRPVQPTRTNHRSKPRGASAAVPTARESFRSRHPVLVALLPVALVVLTIATMFAVKAGGGTAASSTLAVGGPSAGADPGTAALSPSVLASLSSVTPATFDAVGSPGSVAQPNAVGGSSGVLRGSDGKPIVTYVGAEYCPYCAAERWGLAVALSRFGTFSNLSGTQSSGTDVYPDTQTLSFYGSSYTSPYVQFDAVEEASNRQVDGVYQTLQQPTAQEQSLLNRYDSEGNIPFLDIANRYIVTGASYSPQVLQGLSRAQIAAQLNDPESPVAQAIDGTANEITAAISSVTGNQPSSVSNSPAIASIERALGA